MGNDSCAVCFVSDAGLGGTDGNEDGSVSNTLLSICNGGTSHRAVNRIARDGCLTDDNTRGHELGKSVVALRRPAGLFEATRARDEASKPLDTICE